MKRHIGRASTMTCGRGGLLSLKLAHVRVTKNRLCDTMRSSLGNTLLQQKLHSFWRPLKLTNKSTEVSHQCNLNIGLSFGKYIALCEFHFLVTSTVNMNNPIK